MKRFWHDNSLSIVLFGIFFVTIVGMSVTGWMTANSEAKDHRAAQETYIEYLGSGDFVEGVFENWESEFLQMWALVVLTIFLRQKGSDDSKPMRGKIPQDTAPRLKFRAAKTWGDRLNAIKYVIYSHSLSLALLSIFILTIALHAVGGSMAYNEDALRHGEETVSPLTYVGTSQFWYESLQNWQSEFLAVGALTVLSIKLRERGSPQSKPIGSSYDATTGNG